MKFSIVIPTYNGWNRLPALCTEIIKTLVVSVKVDEFEIIIVDDGSQNRSDSLIRDLRNEDVNIKGVFLKRNYGQQLATLAGLSVSTGDFVFTVDDDLAHNPQDFSEMLDPAEKEAMDAVYAIPGESQGFILRKSGSVIRDIIFSIFFRKPAGISVSSFRLLRRSLVVQILGDISEYRYLSVEILKHTRAIVNIKVKYNRERGKTSRYGFVKLVTLAFSIIRCSRFFPEIIRRTKTASEMEWDLI